jgi:hypothetical protein
VLIEMALQNFHRDCNIFDCVCPDGYSLPRHHSMIHYKSLIREFGAPNGLCSSITESKHIKAVKEPWRHSSYFQALGQMLLTNQCLDKLAAVHVDFQAQGFLNAPLIPSVNEGLLEATHASILCEEDDDDDGGVDGELLAEVTLARKPSKSAFSFCLQIG